MNLAGLMAAASIVGSVPPLPPAAPPSPVVHLLRTEPPSTCHAVPVTPNTPTGIAGCERSGAGIGSAYGAAGWGVAMNFCTWTLRHGAGCGSVTILAGGRSVNVPVVDFCDCYTGTPDERIVDMLPAVVDALGLDRAGGLWRVVVVR